MSSMKPTNSKFASVASIVDYLREPSPTEVVSTTTTSTVVDSTRTNNQFKAPNKKQKKEKETANLMDNNISTVERLPSGRVRYGPVTVNPRKQPSKTLFTGRRSKYEILDGEEEEKRRLRRDRNRVAATKCREKRDKILIDLEVECQQAERQHISLKQEVQKLKQKKQYLESYTSNHFLNCQFQQQQQSSTVFGDTDFLSSIEDIRAPPLPPQPFQLVANNEEEFTAFLQPDPVLTNSSYNPDQSNYLFNSQQQTITMSSSSLERIINGLQSPASLIDNNNNNYSGLFNSAFATSSCAQQHSSSGEDDSLPPTHKNPFVC